MAGHGSSGQGDGWRSEDESKMEAARQVRH